MKRLYRSLLLAVCVRRAWPTQSPATASRGLVEVCAGSRSDSRRHHPEDEDRHTGWSYFHHRTWIRRLCRDVWGPARRRIRRAPTRTRTGTESRWTHVEKKFTLDGRLFRSTPPPLCSAGMNWWTKPWSGSACN